MFLLDNAKNENIKGLDEEIISWKDEQEHSWNFNEGEFHKGLNWRRFYYH